MENIKESIENKIKNFYKEKESLDEIKKIFNKPKRVDSTLVVVLLLILTLLMIPICGYFIAHWLNETTIIHNYYIDRTQTIDKTQTILKQPITTVENKPVTIINNTNYVEKKIYLQPENTANCVKVREVKSDGSYTGKYSLLCEEIKK
jgi:flagellar basal body-associated protein FliL